MTVDAPAIRAVIPDEEARKMSRAEYYETRSFARKFTRMMAADEGRFRVPIEQVALDALLYGMGTYHIPA